MSRTRFQRLLAEARTANGFTQVELAERVGMSSQQISRYEHGLSTPRPSAVRKLSQVLRVNFEDVLVFAQTPVWVREPVSPAGARFSESELASIKAFASAEKMSVDSAIRFLVIDGLQRHGAASRPVASAPKHASGELDEVKRRLLAVEKALLKVFEEADR